jgi:hypothetical protein
MTDEDLCRPIPAAQKATRRRCQQTNNNHGVRKYSLRRVREMPVPQRFLDFLRLRPDVAQ